MEGTFNAPAGVTFTGDAEFTGQVNADGVRAARDVEAGLNVTAASVTARSALNAASGYIGSLSVGSCSGC